MFVKGSKRTHVPLSEEILLILYILVAFLPEKPEKF